MNNFMCKTCGVQFDVSESPPKVCPICEDERQYVGWEGQQWTTLEELKKDHKAVIKEEEPGLIGIGTEPSFAIGQRALLIKRKSGNILWDCISLINDEIINYVKSQGGISAIAISHPHYFSSIAEWTKAFGDIPVYIHEKDKKWVMRNNANIKFWKGNKLVLDKDITLINSGGHFEGSSVLHWPQGADGRGALLTGDTIQVVQDRRFVSFMYSYPNLIPLSINKVEKIVDSVEEFNFDKIYGAWFGKVVFENAKEAVLKSAERYYKAIKEE